MHHPSPDKDSPASIYPPGPMPIRIQWTDAAYMAKFEGLYQIEWYDPRDPSNFAPPTILIHRPTWDRLSGAAQRRFFCHELAHHFLPGTLHGWTGFPGPTRPQRRATHRRSEQAATALGDHLATLDTLGHVLVVGGVLTAADGAWLDSLQAEAPA